MTGPAHATLPQTIYAAHVIISAHAFWLPNEPRGSWSDFVRSWELFRYGPATKVDTRRSVAYEQYDHDERERMLQSLARPPVLFTGEQALAIAMGFRNEAEHSGCRLHALGVLENHLHAVVGRHTYDFDKVINRLKGSATRELKARGLHPFAAFPNGDGTLPSPWGRKWWKVYLDSVEDVARAIAYTEENPVKEGKPRQKWSFLVPFWLRIVGFDGGRFHPQVPRVPSALPLKGGNSRS